MKRRIAAVLLAAGMFLGTVGCSQEMAPDWNSVKAAQSGKENSKEKTADKKQENANDFHAASSYKEILNLLQKIESSYSWSGRYYLMENTFDGAMEFNGGDLAIPESNNVGTAGADQSQNEPSNIETPDYSSTNVQVEGIAESDIVKTDGKYIYILSKCNANPAKVVILKIKNGTMETASSFVLEGSIEKYYNEEMYVSGDKLVIVRRSYKEELIQPIQEKEINGYYRSWNYFREPETQILIYDIADRTAPVLTAEHKQDGSLVSSREKDGYLYVISEKERQNIYWSMQNFIEIDEIAVTNKIEDKNTDKNMTDKSVTGKDTTNKNTTDKSITDKDTANKNTTDKSITDKDTANKNITDKNTIQEQELTEQEQRNLPQADGCLLPPESIYLCENSQSSSYTIITSIYLDKPDTILDSISIMANSSNCYVSTNAIYLTAQLWNWKENKDSNETNIVKVGCQDGKFELLAQGCVKGRLDDQFSMDEKNGYLRLVTTVEHYKTIQEKNYSWNKYIGRTNALYVLDKNLQAVGVLEGLAEDEMIYSARFIGDIAYFVTYRNTDPLFSVDLSDPENPKLLGALKIPGFSDYLHPYGEHLLLGIGYDAGDTSEATNFIKLTMFDITDPANVVEKHTLILDNFYSSEACYNHKSVLVDTKKNLIGLSAEGYQEYYSHYIKSYLTFGYDEEKGFYKKFEKAYANDWIRERAYIEGEQEKEPEWTIEEEQGKEWEWMQDFPEWNWNTWYSMQLRGLYIGNYFYMINSLVEAASYKMGTKEFKEIETISLK